MMWDKFCYLITTLLFMACGITATAIGGLVFFTLRKTPVRMCLSSVAIAFGILLLAISVGFIVEYKKYFRRKSCLTF